MSEKYAFSGWIWILAAVIVVGFVALGSHLIQTQQRLKAVEVELGGAREETGRASAGAAELAKVVENLRMELKAANAALNEYQGKLDKANAAIGELSKKLDTVQADLGKRRSQLQDMEAELKSAKQAADQAKAEAAEGETQIVRLKEEVALERQALQSQLERLKQAAIKRKRKRPNVRIRSPSFGRGSRVARNSSTNGRCEAHRPASRQLQPLAVRLWPQRIASTRAMSPRLASTGKAYLSKSKKWEHPSVKAVVRSKS